jgi:hypothetical protein
MSSEGEGAVVVLVPDAPISVADKPDVTLENQIGLKWIDGVSDGGTAIIDYSVWYDQGNSGSFIELQSGILENTYTAIGLTPGVTYNFKVTARNSVGFSPYSPEVSILAAQPADKPSPPSVSNI